MYIHPVDDRNITSFLNGYECRERGKCGFTQLLKVLVSKKYKIKYEEMGWHGQIKRFAEKYSITWVMAFKKAALEVIIDLPEEKLSREGRQIITSRITSLINRINVDGDIWFNNTWEQEWLALCSPQSKRAKEIWTKPQWDIIRAITKETEGGRAFLKSNVPSDKMVTLRERFHPLIKKAL